MAEINRNTVLAVLVETTEGTPVAPSAATDYIAVQDDLSIEPSFDTLENKELRSSIGKAQPIIGSEHPKVNVSHYLRHSGVEGQAPNFKPFLKSGIGAETANGTERTTTSSSSVGVVKLGAGGSDFARGMAMLVKDGANGYSIRSVLSVSTNDVTLGFNLANAPLTGIKVGKCVNYAASNSGHNLLSLWAYRANKAALEVMAGGRVTEMSVDLAAGELINAKYSIEGTQYYFDPIMITATTCKFDFLDDAATRVVTLTQKLYKHPLELAQAIQDGMNALGSSNTFTVTYSSTTGMFTFLSNGTTLTLKWNTGANTANTVATKIGFTAAADSSGALTYTGTAISFISPYTPSLDSANPLAAKDNELFIGDATDTTAVSCGKASLSLKMSRKEIKDVNSASGISGSIFDGREITFKASVVLSQFEAAKFKKYVAGDSVAIQYNFGVKSGGNWVAGKCGCLYMPTATITKFSVPSQDGIVIMDLEFTAYVDSSGNGEFYLNFL